MTDQQHGYRIAVIGGTGPQGKGLGYRFARHGHRSCWVAGGREGRAPPRRSGRLGGLPDAGAVSGAANADACARRGRGDPRGAYDGHDELRHPPTRREDRHLVRQPARVRQAGAAGRVIDGGEGSAAESAQRLAPEATVVGAFHHVSAVTCGVTTIPGHEDILVVGDRWRASRGHRARPLRRRPDGIDAGKLRLARQLEPLTAVLISINRKYKIHSGVRITGSERLTRG